MLLQHLFLIVLCGQLDKANLPGAGIDLGKGREERRARPAPKADGLPRHHPAAGGLPL